MIRDGRLLGLAVLALAAACGDDHAGGESDSGASSGGASSGDTSAGSSGGTTSTATSESSSGATSGASSDTTGAPVPCGGVHEGDLGVLEDSDLASLANLGHVKGNLGIRLKSRDVPDLSFLGCLHTVDGILTIVNSNLLETTEGLVNLEEVGTISIYDNPNLYTVAFDQLQSLGGFHFTSNPAVTEIRLDSVVSMKYIELGLCETANNLSLTSLSGFSSLKRVERLQIEGNEALMSLEILDALAANGATEPVTSARIRFNPLISEAEIHARLDELGVPYRLVCANAGGDPICECTIGE